MHLLGEGGSFSILLHKRACTFSLVLRSLGSRLMVRLAASPAGSGRVPRGAEGNGFSHAGRPFRRTGVPADGVQPPAGGSGSPSEQWPHMGHAWVVTPTATASLICSNPLLVTHTPLSSVCPQGLWPLSVSSQQAELGTEPLSPLKSAHAGLRAAKGALSQKSPWLARSLGEPSPALRLGASGFFFKDRGLLAKLAYLGFLCQVEILP